MTRYRLHLQAEWPRIFPSLAGAIRCLQSEWHLWYILEAETKSGWEQVVSSAESRNKTSSEYEEDRV